MLTKISTDARSSDHRSSDAYNTPHLSTWVRNIPGACTARPQSVPLSVLPQGMLCLYCLHTGQYGTQVPAARRSCQCCICTADVRDAVHSDARSAAQLVHRLGGLRCCRCQPLGRCHRGAVGGRLVRTDALHADGFCVGGRGTDQPMVLPVPRILLRGTAITIAPNNY